MLRGRYLLLIVLALIFSTACSLSTMLPANTTTIVTATPQPQSGTPQPVTIDARTQTDTTQQDEPEVVVVQSNQPQAQSVSASGGSGSGGYGNPTYYVPPYCSPRADWYYTYVVQRGDTLSSIAARAGVHVQVLAQGNCISNPNLIYAGQILRVPRQVSSYPPPYYPPTQPPYYPPPPPHGGVQRVGQVLPSPFVSVYNGQYELRGGTVVNLSWAINAYGLTDVSFYYIPTNVGQAYLIGRDTYFGDGVSIAWAVPHDAKGSLYADGNKGSSLIKQTAGQTLIFVSSLPPTPTPAPPPPVVVGSALTFTPYGEWNNNTVLLPPDELITIRWEGTFPTATERVVFELIPPGGGAGQPIGLDANLGDGATILWRAVNETQGTLRAVAYFTGGYPPQYSDSYYVIARNPY